MNPLENWCVAMIRWRISKILIHMKQDKIRWKIDALLEWEAEDFQNPYLHDQDKIRWKIDALLWSGGGFPKFLSSWIKTRSAGKLMRWRISKILIHKKQDKMRGKWESWCVAIVRFPKSSFTWTKSKSVGKLMCSFTYLRTQVFHETLVFPNRVNVIHFLEHFLCLR